MRIAIGSDHAGLPIKAPLAGYLEFLGHEVVDVGPMSFDPDDDYPDFAAEVAARLQTVRLSGES